MVDWKITFVFFKGHLSSKKAVRYGSTCCMCLVLVWIKCSALYSVFVQPTYTGCRTALASIQLPILTAGSFDTCLPQREELLMDQKPQFCGECTGTRTRTSTGTRTKHK